MAADLFVAEGSQTSGRIRTGSLRSIRSAYDDGDNLAMKPLLRGMCDFAILYDVDLSLGKIGATALIASAVISGAVPMLINAIKGVLMKMIETEVLWDIVLCSGLIAGAVLLEEP